MTVAAFAHPKSVHPPLPPLPPTPREAMDAAVAALVERKRAWTAVPVRERVAMLQRLRRDFFAIAQRWTDACIEAERLDPGSPAAGEEALVGPYMVMRNFRLLEQALSDIERHGRPRIPGPVRTLPNGQVSAQVFPVDVFDRIFYSGVTAEVWMEPGVKVASLPATQAVAYHAQERPGAVCLVLGAGNVSSIGPMDALYKLFVEDQVVLYKTHPVNAFLGPLLEEGFRAVIEGGFLRVVYGGAEEGAYLCHHPGVDEIHITGSDRTYEAIVFGPGEEGRRRKDRGEPLLAKRVTAELGNVSPVIVVPGPWSDKDYDFHGQSLATMLVNNAGFNCNAARVIVNQTGWPGREKLLARVRRVLSQVPPRHAYYPGAADRFQAFLAAHPEAERFGTQESGDDLDDLPWALIPGLDPGRRDDICYTTEAFTGVFSETALTAAGTVDYIRKAVAFCNETLWGSLNVTLIVHPKSLRDPEVAEAVEQAIADLRYGTVSLNQWAAIGYGLVVTPWGAFPGHEPHDIQSGVGFVHNTLMFSRIQKTVVRCPFRVWPKPVWFTTHRTAHELTPLLTRFESGPSFAKLPGITRWVLGG